MESKTPTKKRAEADTLDLRKYPKEILMAAFEVLKSEEDTIETSNVASESTG